MKNKKTLIIFDWDDTLFPTTWAIKSKIDISDPKTLNKYVVFFSKLDNLLYKILSKFSKCGDIIIVTHAMTKWVYMSSTILPNTQEFIKKNIKVISARDLFQKKVSDMVLWKKLIFEKLDQDLDGSNLKNIISVGDAEYELNALINLFDQDSIENKKILKSVKFLNSPSFDSLFDQLEVLYQSIDRICKSNKHLDLKFKSYL